VETGLVVGGAFAESRDGRATTGQKEVEEVPHSLVFELDSAKCEMPGIEAEKPSDLLVEGLVPKIEFSRIRRFAP
jgi:hypothetical protein